MSHVKLNNNDISGFLDSNDNPVVQISSKEKGVLLLNKDNFSTFIQNSNSFFGDIEENSPYSASVLNRSTFKVSALQPDNYSSRLDNQDDSPYQVKVTTLREKGQTTTSQTYYFIVDQIGDFIVTENGDRIITHLFPIILIEYYGTVKKSVEYNTTVTVRTS
tara:strand:+ start:10972 stop:11457 length:486 start_codon:yes stop_codon:yes gene_type:complete